MLAISNRYRSFLQLSVVHALRRVSFAVETFRKAVSRLRPELPGHSWEYSPKAEESIEFYRQMVATRQLELECDKLFKTRSIRGYCHLYDGQEAIAAGIRSAFDSSKDDLVTSYRCHAHYFLAAGGDRKAALAMLRELLGRENGCSGGRGGSMHLYDARNRFWGGNGIVGDQMSQAAGFALANSLAKNGAVSMGLCGDGAANQGQIYECLNMGHLWKLPIIFGIENNQFSMGSGLDQSTSTKHFFSRFTSTPGILVSSKSVYEVKEVVRFARQFALENGPLFIEFDTYRYRGHSMSDTGLTYRTREEIQRVRETRDPIAWIRELIISSQFASEKDLKEIDVAVAEDIRSASEEAQKT